MNMTSIDTLFIKSRYDQSWLTFWNRINTFYISRG